MASRALVTASSSTAVVRDADTLTIHPTAPPRTSTCTRRRPPAARVSSSALKCLPTPSGYHCPFIGTYVSISFFVACRCAFSTSFFCAYYDYNSSFLPCSINDNQPHVSRLAFRSFGSLRRFIAAGIGAAHGFYGWGDDEATACTL